MRAESEATVVRILQAETEVSTVTSPCSGITVHVAPAVVVFTNLASRHHNWILLNTFPRSNAESIEDLFLVVRNFLSSVAETSCTGVTDRSEVSRSNHLFELDAGHCCVLPVSTLDGVQVSEAVLFNDLSNVNDVGLGTVLVINHCLVSCGITWKLNIHSALVFNAVEEEAWLAFSSNHNDGAAVAQVCIVQIIYIAVSVWQASGFTNNVSAIQITFSFACSVSGRPMLEHIGCQVNESWNSSVLRYILDGVHCSHVPVTTCEDVLDTILQCTVCHDSNQINCFLFTTSYPSPVNDLEVFLVTVGECNSAVFTGWALEAAARSVRSGKTEAHLISTVLQASQSLSQHVTGLDRASTTVALVSSSAKTAIAASLAFPCVRSEFRDVITNTVVLLVVLLKILLILSVCLNILSIFFLRNGCPDVLSLILCREVETSVALRRNNREVTALRNVRVGEREGTVVQE